jgi:hypothetical protein
MKNSVLAGLAEWYQQRCNGLWEHDHGVSIQSTDNPGWWMRIDVRGTDLERKTFVEVKRGNFEGLDPQPPWIHCGVENAVFSGAGDPMTLNEIIETFLNWAEQSR